MVVIVIVIEVVVMVVIVMMEEEEEKEDYIDDTNPKSHLISLVVRCLVTLLVFIMVCSASQ